MKVPINKWGNSLALRIPKSVADDARIGVGSELELRVDAGRIIATPLRRSPTLAEFVERITPENRHGEISIGPRRGGETW